jgi:hypothetical protein
MTKERQLKGDLSFGSYIKEKTGYQIDVFENLNKSARRRDHSQNEKNNYRRQLHETYSPDHEHRIIVSESGSDPNPVTQVFLISQKGGASVYIANGIDLDIRVHWRDNNTIVIETKASYEVVSRRMESLQIFDHVFKIDLIEN